MPPRRVLLMANSAWNLWNYRRALVRALQEKGYEVLLAAPEDRFSARLEAPFHSLRQWERGRFSPVALLRAVVEMARLMRREQPALCLFFTIPANLLGGWAAQLARTPYVAVVEGLGYAGSHALRWRLVGRPLFRSVLRSAWRVLFLNADDCQEAIREGLVASARAVLVPGPGVDAAHFAPRPSPVRAEVAFLYCGRLLRNKGVPVFVQAAQAVRAAGVRASFRILGAPDAGNPASLSMEEVLAWHRAGWVEYLGAADDVRPYLAEADAVVLPTYYREGMPRALLEAMCMEKIVIATNTPGCREVVVHGRTGFLVPPRDAQALAQAMLRVVALLPEQRAAMGREARQWVIERLSDRVVLPHYLAVVRAFFEETSNCI
ncbi:MAG: glycosyltransferase family 4 protein [Saprospiraceae bacterium]|nr:glycosyltransferase family 4 protein [Saprospiraceae bacterium]